MLVRSFRIAALMTLSLAGASSAPAPLAAQQVPGARSPIAIPGAEASAWVGWTPTEAFVDAPIQERRWGGRPLAMMAVGGAALVLGLVIGGDGGVVVASAGGLVALVGMYRYLR